MKQPVSDGRLQAMRRILCLWLPNWPIQSAMGGLAAHKLHNSKFRIQNSENPILLHARDPRRGDLVVACNQPAVERGVRLERPLPEAAALVQHDSECLILPHDPVADLTALARLAEHCE